MGALQHTTLLQIFEIFTNRNPRDSQGLREFFDQNPAMLLGQRNDVLAAFLDQHLGTPIGL